MANSPTPWRVDGSFVLDSTGGVVAAMCESDYAADAALICDAVNLKARIDEAMKDKDGFLHPVMLEGRPCVCITPPPSECELERMSREVISGLTKDRALLQRQSYAALKELNRLRDLVQSYGDTIVKLNEAAQRSELKAMRLGDLIHRLSDCILGAHLEGLEGPFHAADGLDACPNVTDNDGMEVLYGDIAEALTVLARAQTILHEAREETGKEEP